MFSTYNLFLPSYSLILGAVLTSLVGKVILEHFDSRVYKQHLAAACPDYLRKITRPEDLINLRRIHADGLVVATDLKGYTGVPTEKLEEIEQLYRNAIVPPLILDKPGYLIKGHIVKFAGDSLLGYYTQVSIIEALDRALAALDACSKLASDLLSKGQDALILRLGFSRGQIICSMRQDGGQRYFDITSKAGALAARLEALNKAFGTQVLISDDLLTKEAQEKYPLLYMGYGKLDSKDSMQRDIYSLQLKEKTRFMKEIWEPGLFLIKNQDMQGLHALMRSSEISGALRQVLKLDINETLALEDSSKANPILAFFTPVISDYSQQMLQTLIGFFWAAWYLEPRLKVACENYVLTLHEKINPRDENATKNKVLACFDWLSQQCR